MARMLIVAASEQSNPVLFLVLLKANDALLDDFYP
jgi:hypothetical protein